MALSEVFNRLRRIADGERANKTFNQGQSRARQQAIAGQIIGIDSQTGLFTILTAQGTTVQAGQQRSTADGTIAGITKSELSGRAVIPAEGTTTTSVGASPPPIIGVVSITADSSASPLLSITGATALTISLNTQAANKVFAGPSSEADATPTFRSLVNADIPTGISPSKVGNSTAQWNAAQLQGRDISTTAPTNLQVLTWDATLATWKPATPNSSGGSVAPYPDLVAKSVPAIYYKMGETSGTVLADSSGNGRDATLISGSSIRTLGEPTLIDGATDTSIKYLTGSSTDVLYSASFGSFSILEGISWEYIISYSAPVNAGLGFLINGSTVFGFWIGSVSQNGTGNGQYLTFLNSSSAWNGSNEIVEFGRNHIVGTWSINGTLKFYINGQLVATRSSGGLYQSTVTGVGGAYEAGGAALNMTFQHYAVYAKVLTAAEISKRAQRVFFGI